MSIQILNPLTPEQDFPHLETALVDPNGLLAIGGCLSPQRLINAYRQGIFPWFSPDEPILWWSPDPRLVLFPDHLHVSRSLNKALRKNEFQITYDQDFTAVMTACSQPREDEGGTWITEEMLIAYAELFELGVAHSIEARFNGDLVGGLYGIAIGQVFFGESMFSFRSNASKIAFVHCVESLKSSGFQLIDCQVYSDHLASLGAVEIPRKQFKHYLSEYCQDKALQISWPVQ